MDLTASLEGSITALALFMLVNSITPGPNNLMLLHGSIKRGFWACRWHMLGITAGVTVMLWLSYWGMAALVVSFPAVMLIIKVLGTLYLLWLTYQMAKTDFTAVVNDALKHEQHKQANATVIEAKKRFGELPLSFGQALLFQWLNPKAWTMTVPVDRGWIIICCLLCVRLSTFYPSAAGRQGVIGYESWCICRE